MKNADIGILTEDNLHYLPPREQTILRLRYGLEGPCKTVREIAAHFDVSPNTIRNVEARAWLKLEHLRNRLILQR